VDRGDRQRVCLSDDGKGLNHAPVSEESASGTGMKLINGLKRRIGAEAEWSLGEGGAVLRLEFDIR
jgi:two-component sensor histidine kinase